MQRGVRRKAVFTGALDCQVFLTLLTKVVERYGCKLHAYCLMTNHYHMLIETDQEPIWKLMKCLSQQYARFYNSEHGYVGHLFEGRYVSVIVKNDTYFMQVSRYIHLNPVKARMVSNPEEYLWSSYRTILRMYDDGLTTSARTLDYFRGDCIRQYRNFVEDAGNKYVIDEEQIRKEIGGDDEWLPW